MPKRGSSNRVYIFLTFLIALLLALNYYLLTYAPGNKAIYFPQNDVIKKKKKSSQVLDKKSQKSKQKKKKISGKRIDISPATPASEAPEEPVPPEENQAELVDVPDDTENKLSRNPFDICSSKKSIINVYTPTNQIFNPRGGSPDYTLTPSVRAELRKTQIVSEKLKGLPEISVIMYDNDEGEALETLRSLSAQTFTSYEILLIQSTDNPWDVIKNIEGDVNLKVIVSTDYSFNARNLAIKEAKGKYLMFLSFGDMLEPTALEKFYYHLQTNLQWGWVASFMVLLNKGIDRPPELKCTGYQSLHSNLNSFQGGDSLMIRTELHHKAGGFVMGPAPDGVLSCWDYVLRLASMGHWGISITEFLIWRTRPVLEYLDSYQAMEKVINYFKEEYEMLWEDGFPVASGWELVKFNEYTSTPTEKYPLPGNLTLPAGIRRENSAGAFIFIMEDLSQYNGDLSLNYALLQHLSVKSRWDGTIMLTGLIHRKEREVAMWSNNPEKEFCPNMGLLDPFTPEVYCLNSFLQGEEFPGFVSEVISSRQPEVVFISGRTAYNMVAWLKRRHTNTMFIDIIYEKVSPGGLEAVVFSSHLHYFLDMTIVPSQELKSYLIEHGVEEDKVKIHNLIYESPICEQELDHNDDGNLANFLHRNGISDEDRLILILAEDFTNSYTLRLNIAISIAFLRSAEDSKHWKFLFFGNGGKTLKTYMQLTQGIDDFQSHVVVISDLDRFAFSKLVRRAWALLIPPVIGHVEKPITADFGGIAFPLVIAIAVVTKVPVLYTPAATIPDLPLPDYFFRISAENQDTSQVYKFLVDQYVSKLMWISQNPDGCQSHLAQAKETLCNLSLQNIENIEELICSRRNELEKDSSKKTAQDDGKLMKHVLEWQAFPIVENLRRVHEADDL